MIHALRPLALGLVFNDVAQLDHLLAFRVRTDDIQVVVELGDRSGHFDDVVAVQVAAIGAFPKTL